jgi:hypothetical protein
MLFLLVLFSFNGSLFSIPLQSSDGNERMPNALSGAYPGSNPN